MKKLLIQIIIAGTLLGCSGEKPFDVSYLNDGFQGITYMNEVGEHNGPVDLTDWKFKYGRSQFYVSPGSISNVIENSSDEPDNVMMKLIPSGYELRPASPNPTNDLFRISFSIPTKSDVVITVVDNNYNIMYQHAGSYEPSYTRHQIIVDQFDSYIVQSGIYRVYVDINGTISGYGDVSVIIIPDVLDIF